MTSRRARHNSSAVGKSLLGKNNLNNEDEARYFPPREQPSKSSSMILYDVCKGPQLLTALYVSAVVHTLCAYIRSKHEQYKDWVAPRLRLEEDRDGGCARRDIYIYTYIYLAESTIV